jgi:glycosyltransferase involved in cell wall biosynthesis
LAIRKPNIVAIVPSFIASCQIGVIKPLSRLANRGAIKLEVRQETKASVNSVHAADLVVFCRNTEPSYSYLLNEAVSTNKPIIYDLDDNFWDVPFETDPELARYHRLPLRIQQLEKYLTQASLVRVYSPVMRDLVSRFNSRVLYLKAGFDFKLLPAHRPKPRPDKIQIVYATSRTVDNQYRLFAAGLLKALNHFGDKIDFTIWGCGPGDLVGQRGIHVLPLVSDYEEFLKQFARSGFDIGLAPLEDTAFHRSKTNTKLRDYGACKVSGIYSNVDVYSSCIEHLKTGLLVDNTESGWFEGISALVQNDELRNNIQNAAFNEVYQQYRQEVVEDEWLMQIQEILASDTSYSLTKSPLRQVTELLIRADKDNFSGFTLPTSSPGDKRPLGKVFVEVLTPNQHLLREAASTCQRSNNEQVQFTFSPIRNSHAKEFVLRFIRPPENAAEGEPPQWLPPAGFIHMLYAPVEKVGAQKRHD